MEPRLRRPALVLAILAWAVVLGLLPPADAAPLPPRPARDAEADPRALEGRLVAARLAALGVSPDDAARRLAALSDAERHELATRLDEADAGGDVVAAVLAIGIIVGLVTVLVLELIGRRVISRPR
jgi:hypothetical protein